MPQFSDDLFLGSAQSYVGTNTFSALGNPAPMDLGFGPMGRVYLYDTTPAVGTVAAVLTAKTPTVATTYSGTQLAATNSTLGISQVIRTDGTTVLQLDYPRAVACTTASGSPTNSVITISGYDYYNNAMTEIIQTGTVASTQTVGRKAFFQISSVAFSAATTVAVSIDTSNVLGLPCRISDTAYVLSNKFTGSLALDSGTLAVGYYGNTTNYATQSITNFTSATPGVATVAYSPPSGTLVQLSGSLGTLTGVALSTTYWWTNINSTTGKLSTTQANYLAGTYIATGGTTITSGMSLVPQLTSTAVTPDIRGTYAPGGTLNSKAKLVLELGLTAIQVGPQATATGLLGIAQA
jgi:hypothetical protein